MNLFEVGTLLKCRESGDLALVIGICDGRDVDGNYRSLDRSEDLYDLFFPDSKEKVCGWSHDVLLEEFEIIA